MRFGRLLDGSALFLLTLPGLAMTHAHRGPTSQRFLSKKASRSAPRPAAQRAIDDTRATQIQTALVGAGYLSGEPTGHWDANTEAAMERYQAANGWQTKLIPDSRAIIKLGLGPSSESSPTSLSSNGPEPDGNTRSR